MNERIKQLHDKAFHETKDYYATIQKFAELIVKECLTIVNRKEYSYHEADPLWETAELIREHFGVEE
jgi:hypothetical protein